MLVRFSPQKIKEGIALAQKNIRINQARVDYLSPKLDKINHRPGDDSSSWMPMFHERNLTSQANFRLRHYVTRLEAQSLITFPENKLLRMAAVNGDIADLEAAFKDGASPHAVDTTGNTALHLATTNNQLAAMKLLLRKGANVHALNQGGGSNSGAFSRQRRWEASITVSDSAGVLRLTLAVLGCHSELVKLLGGNTVDMSALAIDAFKTNNVEQVAQFLRKGVDINKILDYAIKNNLGLPLANLMKDKTIDYSGVIPNNELLTSALKLTHSNHAIIETLTMVGFRYIDYPRYYTESYQHNDPLEKIPALIKIYNVNLPSHDLATFYMNGFNSSSTYISDRNHSEHYKNSCLNIVAFLYDHGCLRTSPQFIVECAAEQLHLIIHREPGFLDTVVARWPNGWDLIKDLRVDCNNSQNHEMSARKVLPSITSKLSVNYWNRSTPLSHGHFSIKVCCAVL